MLEDFIHAIQNFAHNKLRTVLSLLGIAIGVTAVIIITNISTSLYGSMVKLFGTSGLDIINVEPQWNFNARKISFDLTEKYREKLKDSVPEIKTVFYTTVLRANISSQHIEGTSRRMSGIEYGWFDAKGIMLEYGTMFSMDDFVNRRHKIIIGNILAQELFPEGNAVGKKIIATVQYHAGNNKQIRIPFSFEVCGVLKAKDDFMTGSSGYQIYVPRSFMTGEMGMGGNADSADIQVYDSDEAIAVEKSIIEFSDGWANAPESVWIQSGKKQFEKIDKSLKMVSIVLTAIAAISLIVGGINIMNMMMVTVTERKKEIGIRKALGATNGTITKQFLIEAATLTLSGGVFGVTAGMLLSFVIITKLIPADMDMVFVPSVSGTAVSFLVSVFIGIFFGLKPALRASKLDPVIALSE